MDTNSCIKFLEKFTHGARTNLKRNRLSNHDACAFIFFALGPQKVGDVMKILRAWRKNDKLFFTYLFNTCESGGYGFVGADYTTEGNERTLGWFHQWEKTGRYEDGCDIFRRTYWFRGGRGLYAPTLECVKRMAELGFTVEFLAQELHNGCGEFVQLVAPLCFKYGIPFSRKFCYVVCKVTAERVILRPWKLTTISDSAPSTLVLLVTGDIPR